VFALTATRWAWRAATGRRASGPTLVASALAGPQCIDIEISSSLVDIVAEARAAVRALGPAMTVPLTG